MRLLVVIFCFVATSLAANPSALQAINAERKANGRAALVYDNRLEKVAARHAKDMGRGQFFSHTSSDGSSFGDRVNRSGVRLCFGAENIARGQSSLDQVMVEWMNSPGHRKNILARKAKAVGLARTNNDYWVMVLGTRC